MNQDYWKNQMGAHCLADNGFAPTETECRCAGAMATCKAIGHLLAGV